MIMMHRSRAVSLGCCPVVVVGMGRVGRWDVRWSWSFLIRAAVAPAKDADACDWLRRCNALQHRAAIRVVRHLLTGDVYRIV